MIHVALPVPGMCATHSQLHDIHVHPRYGLIRVDLRFVWHTSFTTVLATPNERSCKHLIHDCVPEMYQRCV